MPTYTYRCNSCKKRFEKVMPVLEHERHRRPACPKCGGRQVEQVPVAFQTVTSKKA